ncbi:hypothetical protein P7C71_g2837, partial [Lecanoromycetidae sp. Uapishka_2]
MKDPRAPLQLPGLVTAAGFVDVEHSMIQMPLCGWPNDARNRRIGTENRENIHQTLSTLAILPFTRQLGMTIQEVNRLIAGARRDAANPDLKAYFPVYICIGRKPSG